MDDSKLKSLKAYLDEAADAYLGGLGDEGSALVESLPPEKSLVDRPDLKERFSRNLERRQEARKKMQDEQILAGGLGGLTGALSSPLARVASLPVRMATSAVEEAGRSDPQSALEYLKALAVGAGQGAAQYAASTFLPRFARNRVTRALPYVLDVTQSNASPGLERFVEAKLKKQEEDQRIKAARSNP